jgi:hypothetical protein
MNITEIRNTHSEDLRRRLACMDIRAHYLTAEQVLECKEIRHELTCREYFNPKHPVWGH